ncbi:hypothetical protein JTB14_015094 [Gonioctena quinquepunctata]|nr:hypothetical protein JTB14_015094 [Gonioctena quinquepunctata]
MYNWKCEKQQVKIEKDCLFHEILKVPAEIEPLGKFEVNDECCLEQNLNEPFESIKLEDILSVNGKNPEESKPPITYIESHLKYDKEDSDKIADMQEKPIMNLLNNGKVNIKDEYDFRETEKIKTEYNIDLKYEYVKSEIVGQEWNEHSQETKSKDRIFIERNKSSQEIISRSPTTDSGSRIQQTNVIEGNEIDVKRNKKSKQEIQKRTQENPNEPFKSITLEDIPSVSGKNGEESKPHISYIESHSKYDIKDSDKIADMQEKPIMNIFNNGKVQIKDEYDFGEIEAIKTEYNIDLNYEYVKSEIVGKEWKEHSQETISKDHIFIEGNESSQEITSRSLKTDYGTRIQQTILIEEDEIDQRKLVQIKDEEEVDDIDMIPDRLNAYYIDTNPNIYLNDFQLINYEELHDILFSMNNKGSNDDFTTEFLKSVDPNIKDPLLNLVNSSLQTGAFPSMMKVYEQSQIS